jgi:hypothetical protein
MPVDYAVSGNSVCQVTMRCTLFNQVVMNVFDYRLDLAGGTVAEGAAFLSDFNDALSAGGGFYETYIGCLPAQCVNIEADLQWIDLTRFVKRTFFVNPLGSFSHVPTTANLSAVLQLRGNIADKRSIGTKHIPGLGGTAVAAGLVTAGLLGQIEEFRDQAVLDVAVGVRTMTPIIFGRARPSYVNKHGVTIPAIPKSYRVVTTGSLHNTARVMRRRTVGLGI